MNKIKSIFSLVKKAIVNTAYLNENLEISIKHQICKQHLSNLTMNSDIQGISKEKQPEGKQIIVSLTTYGLRIDTVYLAIESIFQQSQKASKVVLYISKKDFCDEKIPFLLRKQMERGLEIRYVKDIGPYTKLLYALKDYPNDIIITVDDDYIYPIDTIEKLVRVHSIHPEAVCCHHSRTITKKDHQRLNNYNSFPQTYPSNHSLSDNYLAEGFGGVLYPPNALHEDVFKEDLFKKLSPMADDLWFKAMELLNGTPVLQIARNKSWIYEMSRIESVQDTGLMNVNVTKNKNDSQLKAIFDFYHLYDRIK